MHGLATRGCSTGLSAPAWESCWNWNQDLLQRRTCQFEGGVLLEWISSAKTRAALEADWKGERKRGLWKHWGKALERVWSPLTIVTNYFHFLGVFPNCFHRNSTCFAFNEVSHCVASVTPLPRLSDLAFCAFCDWKLVADLNTLIQVNTKIISLHNICILVRYKLMMFACINCLTRKCSQH